MEYKLYLSFYGVNVLVKSETSKLIETIEHDFSYFVNKTINNGCDIKIISHSSKPPYETLPETTSNLTTPRNVCYEYNGKTYIDYFGKALNISDIKKNEFHIYTQDEHLSREIAYLTIISRVCELLEKRHIHRIHALGIEYKGNGVLITVPCGGGKTTLALSLLKQKERKYKLISEDSPLMKGSMLLPFPLRIGLRPDALSEITTIAKEHIKEFKRMEFGTKITIDIRHFSGVICKEPVKTKILFVGVRSTYKECRIKPISKIRILRHCLMNSVIGIGLYQGIEFVMQKSFAELLKHFAVLLSRIYTNIQLLMKVKTFELILGRDPENNAAKLSDFIQSIYG